MFWIIGGEVVFNSLAKVWNNPVIKTIQRQLTHVRWEGFHFEDLIWPLFLFVVGVVLPFSLLRRLRKSQSKIKIYLHIVKRTVVLIFLGLILRNLLHFDWEQMNWTSVLGRLGVCYFFAALMTIHTSWRTQTIVAAVILVSYWAAMTIIPVPGYGAGVLTPQGSLSAYIDQQMLPAGSAFRYLDGSGVLSPTLPAIGTVLLGMLAGHWLGSNRSGQRKTAGLAIAGVAALIAGWLGQLSFPMIKKLWTSTYVLYAGGWSLLLLALFYWLIDVKGFKKWAFFFVVIGMNAIAVYVATRLFDFRLVGNIFVGGLAKWLGPWNDFVQAVAKFAVIWLILYWMYRKKSFIKV